MKTKATLIAIALIMAVMSLTSCNKTPKEMLTGEYAISSITTDLKMTSEEAGIWNKAMEDLKKTTTLILQADGKMQETINGVTKKGTWEVLGEEGEEGETLVLKLIYENKSTVNMTIHDLSSSGFTNTQNDEASHTKTVITYSKTK